MADHQRVAQGAGQPGDGAEQGGRVVVQAEYLAHQGEAVGMHSAGWDANQSVAGDDAAAVQQPAAFRGADDEAGQVKIGGVIDAGELGRFAADEGAAHFAAAPDDAAHQHFQSVVVQNAERQIVEEEERAGAFGQNIVDIQGDQVLADAFEMAQLRGDFQFGADAVGAGDQHGVGEAGQGEQAGEPAAGVQDFGAVGHSGKGFDAVFQAVHSVQGDAGGGVSA